MNARVLNKNKKKKNLLCLLPNIKLQVCLWMDSNIKILLGLLANLVIALWDSNVFWPRWIHKVPIIWFSWFCLIFLVGAHISFESYFFVSIVFIGFQYPIFNDFFPINFILFLHTIFIKEKEIPSLFHFRVGQKLNLD